MTKVILQAGVPRSGNYWLYTILQQAMHHAGWPQHSFIRGQSIYDEAKQWHYFDDQAAIDYIEVVSEGSFYRKGYFREQIPDVDAYIAQCSHVWTHSHWCERYADTLRKFDKIVYIVRDPRDIALSTSRFVFTPFMMHNHPHREPNPETYLQHRLYEMVLSWVYHVGHHVQHKDDFNIHIVFYERLLHTFDTEMAGLLDYLNIRLSNATRESIKQAVHFTTMQQKSPHHLQKGKSGQWTDALSDIQKRQILKIAGPLLEILNYPLYSPQVGMNIPHLPEHIDTGRIQDAMTQSRGKLLDKMRYAYAYARSKRPLAEKIKRGSAFLLGSGRWRST